MRFRKVSLKDNGSVTAECEIFVKNSGILPFAASLQL